MLFGDEDKENSTALWDYETETESINTDQMNVTNEKGILDAIKDSLNYIDGNKQSTKVQTNVPNQTVQSIPNLPSYNVSGDDDNGSGGGDEDDDDDEEEEEISLLDFFLKGESAFTSTTTSKPFVFNVTGKPLLNGMTNSPMQIQAILPENMKNDSMKFSMLPMSLYNMVKDDGTVAFDGQKANQSPKIVSSHPLGVSDAKHTIKEIESKISPIKNHVISASTATVNTVTGEVKTTTHLPKETTTTTTVRSVTKTTTATPTIIPNTDLNVRISNETTKINKIESVSVKSAENKTEITTQKTIEPTTKPKSTFATTSKPKSTKSSLNQNVTKSFDSTTERVISSTTKPTTVKATPTLPKIDTSTVKTTVKTTTKPTIKPTTKVPIVESTTTSVQPLTAKSTALPKITAVQINSNPSILETDLSYDYSEPTLPPSLPNLKIIPFLPTDAVKNIIHRNDGYKPNYNYYQPSTNPYVAGAETLSENTAYSPFNVKPNVDKYPAYSASVADDRIDYDSYKMPAENVDGLDYINVYAGNGNMVQPSSFQLSVNSNLDFGTTEQKVQPSKIPPTVNKNMTVPVVVKPPLPSFEPEHEYNLYNPPPQPQLDLGNGYNEYSVNGPVSNDRIDPFPSEHNYNVPHFVTMPPLKEPPHRPVANKDTVFSYGSKNKFIPPAKTEGTLVYDKKCGRFFFILSKKFCILCFSMFFQVVSCQSERLVRITFRCMAPVTSLTTNLPK